MKKGVELSRLRIASIVFLVLFAAMGIFNFGGILAPGLRIIVFWLAIVSLVFSIWPNKSLEQVKHLWQSKKHITATKGMTFCVEAIAAGLIAATLAYTGLALVSYAQAVLPNPATVTDPAAASLAVEELFRVVIMTGILTAILVFALYSISRTVLYQMLDPKNFDKKEYAREIGGNALFGLIVTSIGAGAFLGLKPTVAIPVFVILGVLYYPVAASFQKSLHEKSLKTAFSEIPASIKQFFGTHLPTTVIVLGINLIWITFIQSFGQDTFDPFLGILYSVALVLSPTFAFSRMMFWEARNKVYK